MRAIAILILSATAALAQTPPAAKTAPPAAPQTAPKTAPTTAAKTPPKAPAPNPLLNPAGLKAIAPAVFKVKFTTTHGDFVVEVHRDWAPKGADRFYNLVRNRFYTNAAFFRVIAGAIVQFGMSADPAVSKAWENAVIRDDPPQQSDKRGTLVFATRGPNTRTTQLFINLRDNTPYDPDYIPFGMIVEGIEVVDGIYSGYGQMPDQEKITSEGKAYLDRAFPKLDFIKSATIVPAAPATPAPAAPAKTVAPAPVKK